MRILFDHNTPYGLARYLLPHSVTRAKDRGWARLTNGNLLEVAQEAGFDVLLTADKNMRYQQNLAGRRIALVALQHSPWRVVQLHLKEIVAAVQAARPGGFTEVEIPLPPKKPFTSQ